MSDNYNGLVYEKDSDGIVLITMDMKGPVNAANTDFEEGMKAILERLKTEVGLTGVVIASAKSTFFAGADIKQIINYGPGDEEDFFEFIENSKQLFRDLEKLPVPVVATINGAAMGGGFELCLGCNYRIAWNNKAVKIGLPEVGLGVLPGGGGIVRMVNLLGLQKALPYLLEGKPVGAEKAFDEGLVNELVATHEDLVPRAKAWILQNKDNEDAAVQPWDRKRYKIPGGDINNPKIEQFLTVAPLALMKKTRGLIPAAERILETAVESLKLDFDAALKVESRNLTSLVVSPVAKNMINTFFFQMNQIKSGASRPEHIAHSKVEKVGIIGAGMMGQGIAFAAAKAGINVVLADMTIDAAEKGKAYSAKLLDKAIQRGRESESGKQVLLSLIKATADTTELAGCDFIIEAVFEDMDLKNGIARTNEGRLAPGGVWASNTSGLPITLLAEASSNPERFIGLHFFSPVDKMPAVEIVCGEKTSAETLAKAFDFVTQIRKTPIIANDGLGFFTTRTFFSQPCEATQMVAEGVHPVRVDAMGKAIGMPVGPLTMCDEVSLRLGLQARETYLKMGLTQPEDDERPLGSELMSDLVKKYNRLGRYHGDGGFYDYSAEGKSIWPKLLELYYKAELEISDEDIKDRLLFSNVVECLKCLQEGKVQSVADANVGSILGVGAPTWTGGYIQFVNTYGLQRFIDRCDELAVCFGDRFKAPSIVAETLAAGKTFQ